MSPTCEPNVFSFLFILQRRQVERMRQQGAVARRVELLKARAVELSSEEQGVA